MIPDWLPTCPNCRAATRQDFEEELSIFYEGDALHVHGFPVNVTCGKCRWEYTYEYSCAECVAEATEDGGTDAKAPKKRTKKSRKSD